MRILAIIPARGGSKGIPRKNIKLLKGKPLIQHAYEQAVNANCFDRIILSSEDEEIIAVAKSFGLEVPFKRPDNLATDEAKSIEVVKHALNTLSTNGEEFDAVCILQPTSPLRISEDVELAVYKFVNEGLTGLISVRKVPDKFNPHWVFESNSSGCLKVSTGEEEIISRRQELPDTFFRDGSIYLTRTDIILNEGSLYGNKLGYIDLSERDYINLDTELDWQILLNKI
ncbi:MAG: cytidylyltransferase domain-containing protein [Flavobacteriaceae bacterium]